MSVHSATHKHCDKQMLCSAGQTNQWDMHATVVQIYMMWRLTQHRCAHETACSASQPKTSHLNNLAGAATVQVINEHHHPVVLVPGDLLEICQLLLQQLLQHLEVLDHLWIAAHSTAGLGTRLVPTALGGTCQLGFDTICQ